MSAALDMSTLGQLVAATSLEWKLTDPAAFGLTTASPVQRAFCRIADGLSLGELECCEPVMRAFGDVSRLHGRPREVSLVSGIRTGKSLLTAALAVHWSQRCDLSHLGGGEVPRVSIVSLKKDLADVVFAHVVGRLQASTALAPLMIGNPTTDTVRLMHPSGRPVEIKVVAGARAGHSLVARWSAGCIFDEFPRMIGQDDGVVNWDDSRDAVLLRLLPGAQIAHVGSPWAPYGPAYEMVAKHWRKPTRALVVARAPAYEVNPAWWTPKRVREAKADPDVYRTDVLAEFATPEQSLIPSEFIELHTRAEPEVCPAVRGCTYYAAMDPATRGNGWTLVVTTRRGPRIVIALAKEWVGSRGAPLDPGDVLDEIAALLRPYGITTVDSDQHLGDALVRLGRDRGLNIVQWTHTDAERTEKYLEVRTRILRGEVEFPAVAHLREDLVHLRRRVTNGGTSIVLPQTSDGRHCDFAPPVMLAVARHLKDERQLPPPKVEDEETKQARARVLKKWRGDGYRWE